VLQVPSNYHARFDATQRIYTYRIVFNENHLFKSPFYYKTAWQYSASKKLSAINLEETMKAATVLQGTHDFTSFYYNFNGNSTNSNNGEANSTQEVFSDEDEVISMSEKKSTKSPIKTLHEISITTHDLSSPYGAPNMNNGLVLNPMIEQDAFEMRITFRGKSFLHHQIRIMVATLLQVAMGKLKASDVEDILKEKSRKNTNTMAPAHGLYLVRVHDKMDDYNNGNKE